jgi:hypothetical protein
MCLRPKWLGGLGIKDLDKFGRALRMRWLWYYLDSKARPRKHLLKVTDQVDKQFFFTSTSIQLGDGKLTPFWKANWLNGQAPKDLAPNLFRISRFKTRNIHTELNNHKWISNLAGITSTTELEEFTLLFMAMETVTLTDQPDTIKWKWTSDGNFSVASAYDCQFLGAVQRILAMDVWKARAKPRRFFLFGWCCITEC